ncbi:polysaccharide biosynthesis protein [Deinococcus peraridilitoris]|uniref:Putative nucleoside-diphosphate sugar epimerase n=1 Tax=Deinococcus peraridilitoris (strain DSM 19664 / LMG 22246 / CIP 109416 / KR-200) TaxID=937777 RepID=K9ZZX3_DEIPD|nr:nucleoside-diphosphate sugar epimerase/dehydratase [Deinococcus peraridilitoris]AFZ66487.1 putative nucleoside-diphosphate sugar epimerase [Deinococcus peraridilitoris DSM 19664]
MLLRKYLIDLSLWTLAAPLAFVLRAGMSMQMYGTQLVIYVLAGVLLKMALISHYRLNRQAWGRSGTRDLYVLARAVGVGTLTSLALCFLITPVLHVPRSIPIIEGILAALILGGVRLGTRAFNETQQRQRIEGAQKVLIVGAGEAGIMIAREMLRHPEAGLVPVAFVDDRLDKQRRTFVGLPVLGTVDMLADVVQRCKADEVLIAVPSAAGQFVRRVVDLARTAGVRYRIMPGMFEILSGQVDIAQIRNVNVEDLLRRDPVQLDTESIAGYLREQVVLVTGAGGSIGSEIVRQIARFVPRKIVLLGRGENSVFSIQQELLRDWPEVQCVALIGDVRDATRLRAIFQEQRPSVVFHAAAHKHVPLMEDSPSEAILNNIVGTRNIAELCLEFQVARLVNISTDKAVNPTSVMGATKRIAEMVISTAAQRARPEQSFVSVRFGNVLGSRGSVIPTFLTQIRAGGPVTVTHPEMRRYFMTIPEAARLVLQAGGLAQNGNVYVLDMGEPVKIADLAQDVIRLSGARNIEVVFTGVRPGEKLYEELLTTGENVGATSHRDIFVAQLERLDPSYVTARVRELEALARDGRASSARAALHQLIPESQLQASQEDN